MDSLIFKIMSGLFLTGILFWFIIKVIEKTKSSDNLNEKKIGNYKASSSPNMRKYDRINKNFPVEIKRNNGINEIFIAETKDISIMGAFIICKNKININEDIQINFNSVLKNNIWLDAKVVWSNTHLPEKKVIIPGFGVKFLNLETDKKNILYSIIDNSFC